MEVDTANKWKDHVVSTKIVIKTGKKSDTNSLKKKNTVSILK